MVPAVSGVVVRRVIVLEHKCSGNDIGNLLVRGSAVGDASMATRAAVGQHDMHEIPTTVMWHAGAQCGGCAQAGVDGPPGLAGSS